MDAFELLRSRDEIAAGRETMLKWYAPFDRAALIGHLSELRLAPGVKEGFARLKKAGVKLALVSITWEFAVGWLASELGADYAVGTGWQDKGTIVHFWPEDKASYLNSLISELGIDRSALAAVGDSHGDIPMLNLASRSYFVGEHLPSEPMQNTCTMRISRKLSQICWRDWPMQITVFGPTEAFGHNGGKRDGQIGKGIDSVAVFHIDVSPFNASARNADQSRKPFP
ncbi:HAD superfamily hydrolase domain-containing protein (plasmid) [Rhizobium etli]|uniref:HAD superfamily hydrolase domain-containing protein n=2 Tax=Rhizobium etli TaxID=29449 RepID=A0AAN1BLG8_RHIET|nr:HAD superfamily hydrolase domain-containing protein [Rhizobium etli]